MAITADWLEPNEFLISAAEGESRADDSDALNAFDGIRPGNRLEERLIEDEFGGARVDI